VVTLRHTPPTTFQPGRALAVEVSADRRYETVRLHNGR
jgi:hypothetical protein